MPIVLQYIDYTLIVIMLKYSICVLLWFNFSNNIKWIINLILVFQGNEGLLLKLIQQSQKPDSNEVKIIPLFTLMLLLHCFHRCSLVVLSDIYFQGQPIVSGDRNEFFHHLDKAQKGPCNLVSSLFLLCPFLTVFLTHPSSHWRSVS